MRVLGVDPGLTRCGVGVVDGEPGRAPTLVDVMVVRTGIELPLGERLLIISDAIDSWLERYAPDAVAVERVFSQHNVSSVMGTAQVGGIAMLAATRRGIPVAMHTPSEVKAAVTGNGRANKDQVTLMVTRLLRLTESPSPADAADALALAMCHAWRAPAMAARAVAVSASATSAAKARAASRGSGGALGARSRPSRRSVGTAAVGADV